jgi:hypothetical protein
LVENNCRNTGEAYEYMPEKLQEVAVNPRNEIEFVTMA